MAAYRPAYNEVTCGLTATRPRSAPSPTLVYRVFDYIAFSCVFYVIAYVPQFLTAH